MTKLWTTGYVVTIIVFSFASGLVQFKLNTTDGNRDKWECRLHIGLRNGTGSLLAV